MAEWTEKSRMLQQYKMKTDFKENCPRCYRKCPGEERMTAICTWDTWSCASVIQKELQQKEAITQNHSQTECRIIEPSSIGHIYNTTPKSKPPPQGTLNKRGEKDYKSQRNGKFAVKLCFLELLDGISIKSQESGCLNRNWKRTALIDMVMWMEKGGEPQRSSFPYKELQASNG